MIKRGAEFTFPSWVIFSVDGQTFGGHPNGFHISEGDRIPQSGGNLTGRLMMPVIDNERINRMLFKFQSERRTGKPLADDDNFFLRGFHLLFRLDNSECAPYLGESLQRFFDMLRLMRSGELHTDASLLFGHHGVEKPDDVYTLFQ